MIDDLERTSAASEPRERSAPAQRRARERVGESEGRSPSDDYDRRVFSSSSMLTRLASRASAAAVLPSPSLAEGSTPALSRRLTVSAWPLTAAHIRPFLPSVSRERASAP